MILPLISHITNLTVGNVWFYLNLYNVQYPDIVLRQSILETGWYRCEDCSMDVNNMGWFWGQCYDGLDGDAYVDDDYNVTHWMPLPEPPSVG